MTSVEDRARRYINQCAPHQRKREWYKLIEELLAQLPDKGPEYAAEDLLEGFNRGLKGEKLLAYARRRLPKTKGKLK